MSLTTKTRRLRAQLLLSDGVRRRTAWARYHWFTKIRRRRMEVATTSAGVSENAVMHAQRWLRYDFAGGRATLVLRPLSVLPQVRDRIATADVLTIGPRSEGELLNFVAHGFTADRIRAADLNSYSPWITAADMHNLPWPDDSFDVILSGWAITYSHDRERCLAEIIRVARPGAVVAIGVPREVRPLSWYKEQAGYQPGAPDAKFADSDDILNLFPDGAVKKILWRADPIQDEVDDNIVLIVEV